MTKYSPYLQHSRPLTPLRTFSLLILFLLFYSCTPATPLIPNFPLNTTPLDPLKTGFSITGNAVGDYFGFIMSAAGDIDGDGYNDIVIGAYEKNGGRGMAYVIYGAANNQFSNIDLSSPTTTLDPLTTGFTIKGGVANDKLGRMVQIVPDINNDGYDELIIGAPWRSTVRGIIYVIYGGPRSSFSNLDFATATLDPATTGFWILGHAANDYFGGAICGAGDVNKDGYQDIIIGALRKGGTIGAGYVVYGGPKSSFSNMNMGTTPLDPLTTGFSIMGEAVGDSIGWSVSSLGDINKDGYDDIIIGGAWKNNYQGVAYVIYGGPKASLPNLDFSVTTLDPATNGFRLLGSAMGDYFAYSVGGLGDLNNDGYNDIIIGAPYKNSNQGIAYIIYGREKSEFQNYDFSLSTTVLDPATTGFTIVGNAPGDFFGWWVTRAGDVNGDGFQDMIIGSYGKNTNQGAAYVLYGGLRSSLPNLDLSKITLDPAQGFMITGNGGDERLGRSVGRAGDINKDGYDDIIVSAHGKNGYQGIVYVVHAACITKSTSPQCVPRVFCESCDEEYSISNPNCQNCASNCQLYSGLTTCQACDQEYFLKNSLCENCPLNCQKCRSATICDICNKGYTLTNNLCLLPSLQAEAKASQAISSTVTGIGSGIAVGSSTFALASLVSKIVQNTRYLDLIVTEELAEIYKTWDTELISWDLPNVLSSQDNFKKMEYLFAQYGLDSPFLVNFWSTIMTLSLGLLTFVSCIALKIIFRGAKSKLGGWLKSLLQKLLVGSLNFTIVQAYGCLDDILFYFTLDIKTNPFNKFFCWASLFCSVGFIALGCFFILFNIWTVKEYQRLKTEGLSRNDLSAFEAFKERFSYWELFYADFNDANSWSQSFLALSIVRSSISSLITAALPGIVVIQTGFLLVIDGAIILFLLSKKPFASLRPALMQYFFEIITLLVHGCTFILSLQRNEEHPSEDLKSALSTCIIYLNSALVRASIGFLFIEIYKTINDKFQAWRRKKQHNDDAQVVPEEGSEASSPPVDPMTNSVHNLIEIRPNLSNNEAGLENVNLISQSREYFTGVNVQQVPGNNLTSSLATENSLLPHNQEDDMVNYRDENNTIPIIIQQRNIIEFLDR